MPFLLASGLLVLGDRLGPLGDEDSDFDPNGVANLLISDRSGTELFLRNSRSVRVCGCACMCKHLMQKVTSSKAC